MAVNLAYTPKAVVALADAIAKDVAYRLQTISDEHGTETNVSARMLRYTLNDAHAACGGINASAIAGALLYYIVSYANGTQSLSGLTAKPCKPWMGQQLTAMFNGIKPGKGCTPDSARIAALALLDKIASNARPEVATMATTEGATATATATPTASTGADNNADRTPEQSTIARLIRHNARRTITARKMRALRATIAQQADTIAQLRAELASATAPKASTAKASTTKASTAKASTAKASTAKASTAKASLKQAA